MTPNKSVYSPFIKRWVLALASSRIWRFFVISSYTVQCMLRTLKFEKGPKRVPEQGFEPQNALLQAGSNGLDFDGFSQFSAFGAKPGRNPILAMACFLDKKNFRNIRSRGFHNYGIAEKNSKKNSTFDPFMAKS